MAQKTGRIFIKLGADQLQSKPGAKVQLGGIQREADMSDAGQVFDVEKMVPSMVECTLIHTAETDVDQIKAFRGTIEFRCDTGRVYTLPESFYMDDSGLQNGELPVRFGGAPGIPS